ncbi:VWA domain-containing protein [Granulicella arctica]|uniref:VWFA-related protein n=1 Tax=Granulicella arctica TaxID=940613 RepID=A0A7Y9TFF1_9BACT|nr:VWA domain-containing protein [Granulicella arctica]NYF78701.1 VWFA-related protein [Granulicella arctica]
MRRSIVCGLLMVVSVFAGECRLSGQEPQASPAASSAPAPVAPAQTPPATSVPPQFNGEPVKDANGVYTIRKSSRIVVLDVVVTDAKGNIVPDLKREDFSVTEAKEPQEIQNFEPVGAHALSPDVTINSTAELDQLAPRAPVNIVLLDEFNTRFEDMAFARYSLKKFLEKQPDKLTTPTMLIAVNLQNFTVLHDYTQDKQAIIDALDHHFVAYPWQVHQYSWVAERYGTAFGTLMRVAEATIGHPGHKNMIWIGRGFPAFNFANAPVDAQQRVNTIVQRCVNMLRDARITLYSIDPAGLMVNPAEYGSAAAFNDPFGGNYEFNKLAAATGGRALYGRNDVDAEIGTSARDGSSTYTLTYRPTNTSMDPEKFRKIQVTVNRPGLTATTRKGYYLQYHAPRPDPMANPQTAQADPQAAQVNRQNPPKRVLFDLGAAESSTMVYDGVPVTLKPVDGKPDSFTVHVEGRGLAWSYATATEPRQTEVIVMASTFDKKNKELKRIARNIRVKAPADVAPTGPLDRSLDLVFDLDHDAKAVRARFVVRVSATGRIGTADTVLGAAAGS